jgi:pimeloyl-ACP methyl ester carboxylesterase
MAKSRKPEDNYTIFDWSSEEIEKALDEVREIEALKDYFGKELFDKIQALPKARSSRSTATRGGTKTLILPGIMGSTIGEKRSIWDRVVWVNPLRLSLGQGLELARLSNGGFQHTSLDVLPYFYFFLRRRLSREGFDPEYHYYDWRKDLETLAEELSDRIQSESKPVNLVAHSMGGLVARLAMRDEETRAKVERLVLIGTPSLGSYSAVQLFNGSHSTAGIIERLDLTHSSQELSEKVFNTLPAIYQLLPHGREDIYKSANWPSNFPKPNQELLDRAAELRSKYPDPDPATHFVIATASLATNIDVTLSNSGITYTASDVGDGTVPFESACLKGVKTKIVSAEHQSMPNDTEVINTVVQVLSSSAADWPNETPDRKRSQATWTWQASDAKKSSSSRGKPTHHELFASIGSPPPNRTSMSAASGGPPDKDADSIMIGLRPRRRLILTLAHGDVTLVETRVVVAGVYQNVQLGGAIGAINDRLSGIIDDLIHRRMFEAKAGQVFLLPTPGRAVGADMVMLTGLGQFDKLDDSMHSFVASNVIRTLLQAKIQEFSTVVFGTTVNPEKAFANIVRGFLEALEEADPKHRFQRITFCNVDHEQHLSFHEMLKSHAMRGYFGQTEIIIETEQLAKEPPPARGPGAKNPSVRAQSYLTVRGQTRKLQEDSEETETNLEFSLLSSTGKATIISDQLTLDTDRIDTIIRQTAQPSFSVDRLGTDIVKTLLPQSIRVALDSPEMANVGLTIINNAIGSRVPWETMKLSSGFPALRGGISRRLETNGLNISKWLERRKQDKTLRMLLVINPTEDLDGAKEEGVIIKKNLGGTEGIVIDSLEGQQATKSELLKRFSSGDYDVIHYAGHAMFDPSAPEQSGILASDGKVTGAMLSELAAAPTLVFFNACESGRVRKTPAELARERILKTTSFAEAFLANGIPQMIGTFWPVGDQAATIFAKTFYSEVMKGAAIGTALLLARNAIEKNGDKDWADYIHYGDPNFSIKDQPKD